MSEKMIVACPECQTRFVAPLEKFLPDGRKVRCAKCGHSWFHRVETDSVADAVPAPAQPEPVKAPPAPSIMDRAIQAADNQTPRREPVLPPKPETSGNLPLNVSTAAATTAVVGAVGVAAANTTNAASETVEDFGDRVLPEEPDFNEPSPISTGEPAPKRRSWLRFVLYALAAAIIAGALGYFFKDAISKQVPALASPLTSWKETVDGVVSKVIPAQNTLKIGNVEYDIVEADGERAMLLTATVRNEAGSVVDAPKLEATLFGPDKTILETVIVSPEEPVSEIGAQTELPYFLRLPYPPENLEGVEVDFVK